MLVSEIDSAYSHDLDERTRSPSSQPEIPTHDVVCLPVVPAV
ncbi:hypothetical protein [uncultured Roseibium sp.]